MATIREPFAFDPENVTGKYILNDEGEAVPEPDLIKWAMAFDAAERVILQDSIGHTRISTIFLGIDYNHARIFDTTAPPILWETMVFGSSVFDLWCQRYTSKLDAIAGHMHVRALIERFGSPPRKTKKALTKRRTGITRPGDVRRVERWYARVRAHDMQRAARDAP